MTHPGASKSAILLAAAVCLAHFASFEIAHSPIVWDTRYYLYFASRVAHGEVPYRDFFEFKMPLSIFTGAAFHRLGLLLDIPPIHAIRAGYLTLAAAAGLALFLAHRRLAGRSAIAGFLALSPYLAVPLMGLLPAIGVCPKTLVALFAPLTALAVGSQRFVLAGACGALAFLDWQVGGLAAVAAVAGALATPGSRLASAGRSLGGILIPSAVLAGYLAATGAVGAALAQTIGTLLDRGEEVSHRTLQQGLVVIARNAGVGSPGQEWVFAFGVVGMAIYPVWLYRRRREDTFGMAIALAVYHYGLVAFSLFDFQSYFDLYILIASLAFFAGVALVEALDLACRLVNPARRSILGSTIALIAIIAARPAWWGGRPDLNPPTIDDGATLEDQREVLKKVLAEANGRRIAFLAAAELPYLGEQASVAPFIYWDSVAYRHFRLEEETYLQTRNRLLRESKAEVLVGDRTLPPEPGDLIIAAKSGFYRVTFRPLAGARTRSGDR